jgi:predicted RNase H-like HicB family nuclease
MHAMATASYVLIVRPDPQADGRYVAVCPDIPGWYATGHSPAEASAMGAEIVRGIVSERRSSGAEVPAVHTQTVQVNVPPAPAPQAPKPATSLSESEGFQALAAVVAESRGARRADAAGQYAPTPDVRPGPGRVLKSDRTGPST